MSIKTKNLLIEISEKLDSMVYTTSSFLERFEKADKSFELLKLKREIIDRLRTTTNIKSKNNYRKLISKIDIKLRNNKLIKIK